MSEEQAFLNAIAADPDDDVPRLVFADWLTEHGREDRAELIRVQCRLAGMAANDPDIYDLRRRERELLDRHETEWRTALPPDVDGGWRWGPYNRGFAETVIVDDWPRFERVADSVFAAQPVRRMVVSRLGPDDVSAFVECPLLARLTALSFDRDRRGHENADGIAFCRHLKGLRCFGVRGNGDGRRWVSALADHVAFPQLRALDLSALRHLDGSVARLFSGRHWPELGDLDLTDSRITADQLLRMCVGPGFARLVTLRLTRCHVHGPDLLPLRDLKSPLGLSHLGLAENPIGGEGAANLGDCDALAGLKSLDMNGCGVSELPTSGPSFWRSLKSLYLRENHIGDRGLRTLVSWPDPALELLNLEGNQITDVSPMADWEGLANLRELNLSQIYGGEFGLQRLLTSEHVRGLRALRLWHCGDGDAIVERLVGPALAGMCMLDILGDNITDRSVRAITECGSAADLRVLKLRGTPMTDESATAILRSPHMRRLSELAIDGRSLSSVVLGELRERFGTGFTG